MSDIGRRVFVDCIFVKGFGKIVSITPGEVYHVLLEGREDSGPLYFERDEFKFVCD